MSSSLKDVYHQVDLEGLKMVEYEQGVGGKNSPISYSPEQDPLQDAHENSKKTTYFDSLKHVKQAQGGDRGIQDSQAVFTAYVHCHTHV